MNVRGTFYKELSAKLLAIVDNLDKPIIKHIDLWNDQLNDDWDEPFETPAIFLEFAPIPWKSVGGHRQMADTSINLHLVNDVRHQSKSGSKFIDKALLHLDIIDVVNHWITGWRGSCNGSLSRTNSIQDHYYGKLIRHTETYKVRFEDTAAMIPYGKVEGDKYVLELEKS